MTQEPFPENLSLEEILTGIGNGVLIKKLGIPDDNEQRDFDRCSNSDSESANRDEQHRS